MGIANIITPGQQFWGLAASEVDDGIRVSGFRVYTSQFRGHCEMRSTILIARIRYRVSGGATICTQLSDVPYGSARAAWPLCAERTQANVIRLR